MVICTANDVLLGVLVTGQQAAVTENCANAERMHGEIVMRNQCRWNGCTRITVEVEHGIHSAFVVHQILRPGTVARQQVD